MATTNDSPATYEYQIDADDRIVHVCSNWLRFAVDNATPELSEEAIIGQPISRFIAGSNCRALYHSIIGHVRESGVSASIPFRCDAPTLKRFMEMHISRISDDRLQFRVQLIREEPQSYCAILDPEYESTDQWITMCSWCKSVRLDDESWLDIFEAFKQLSLFTEDSVPNVTHGMCPDCEQTFVEQFRKRDERGN